MNTPTLTLSPRHPFRAFRILKVADQYGHTAQINVPDRLTEAEIRKSCFSVEHFAVMHAGAFSEVTFQAFLQCVEWFKVHRPKAIDRTVTDYTTRIRRALLEATKYQQRLAEPDFIEAYFGLICGDQTENINRLRSALYDLFKDTLGPTDGLDAAFIAQVYACAAYQCSVCEAVMRAEFAMTGIQWRKAFRRFFLDDVANFADRILLTKYRADIVAQRDRMGRLAGYVFEDMTRVAFDPDRIEHNIREAYSEIPEAKRQKYGPVENIIVSLRPSDYKYQKP